MSKESISGLIGKNVRLGPYPVEKLKRVDHPTTKITGNVAQVSERDSGFIRAALTRLHIGLESGYDSVLKFMDKGVTAAEHIEGGKNVVASGISLCEYVLLGAGGKKMWREHAIATAKVLSEINPDYIRIRTLTINNKMPLYNEVVNGYFVRSNDEDIVREERIIIENLNCTSNFISDHATNLLQELEGKLPGDKKNS